MSVLRVENVTKLYGEVAAVSDVSFELEGGHVYGLLGPNGSGKTTCLHVVTGLVDPTTGRVAIGDVPIADPASRLGFGFAPDDLQLPTALTGREFLDLHDRLRHRDDRARATSLLEAFDLVDALDQQIEAYSHGMKRKIQIVAAVMHAPPLLILDEPFRGLDPDAVAVLRSVISSFAAGGRAVLLATHDMARAQLDCDRVVVLDSGVLVADDEPAALVAEHGSGIDLETAFFVLTGRDATARQRKALVDGLFAGD